MASRPERPEWLKGDDADEYRRLDPKQCNFCVLLPATNVIRGFPPIYWCDRPACERRARETIGGCDAES